MAGSLVKIKETVITSATASVTLTGINSTYQVYIVTFNDVQGDTDNTSLKERYTVSGTPQTTANYDYAAKTMRDSASFTNNSATNQTELFVNTQTAMGTGTGETLQGIRVLFNFNSSTTYSHVTTEMVFRDLDSSTRGGQGAAVYTVNEAHDGVNYFFSSGNIASGRFVLYGLKNS